MDTSTIIPFLESRKSILNGHFAYTSGLHGVMYIDMRQVGHESTWLHTVGGELGERIKGYEPDLVIGPETLGRSLAELAAPKTRLQWGLWCNIEEGPDGVKRAVFSPKLKFGRLLLPNMRVGIVDDLLTTGGSFRLVADLVRRHKCEVVGVAAVVRRTPNVKAKDCGAPELEVLTDVEGFVTYTPDECREFGPCSQRVPMMLRPGHGWQWAEQNPGYPTM